MALVFCAACVLTSCRGIRPVPSRPSVGKAFAVLRPGDAAAVPVAAYDHSGPVGVRKLEAVWSWDDTGLILDGQVQDKTPVVPDVEPEKYSAGYKYDSVEFWVGHRQYCAGLTKNSRALWSFADKSPSPAGKLDMRRTPDGYSLRIVLPWSELGITPADGVPLSLAVGVNDVESAGGRSTQSYAPPGWVWRSVRTFAKCTLADEFQPHRHHREFAPEPVEVSFPGRKAMAKIEVEVDVSKPLGPVNRKVFGVCAHAPPWGEREIERSKSFLADSSIRVWVRPDSKWNAAWANLVRGTQPDWVLGFTDKSWHPEKVVYRSAEDNNLFGYQLPKAVAKLVRDAESAIGLKLDAYELWNEPEFAVNGAWPPEDMARYVTDCSVELRKHRPELQVGAFLTKSDWNRTFLSHLEKGRIDFVDHHYYNTRWFGLGADGELAYAGKVGYTPVLRERIRADLADIAASAPEPLPLITSEWGIHPKTYKAPYDVCHDIGAVIFHASTLLAFMEEGVFAAQYFKLTDASKDPLAHFRLINQKHPEAGTGNLALFSCFGTLFNGRLLRVRTACPNLVLPSFYNGKDSGVAAAPIIHAGAALADDGRTLCLVVINKHVSETATISTNLGREWRVHEITRIASPELDSTEVAAETSQTLQSQRLRVLNIRPRSVNFVTLRGKR